MSPLAGALEIDIELASGAVAAPFTLWPPAFAMAWPPSVSVALTPEPLRIVPPFNVRAPASTLMPSLSRSVASVT